MTYAIEKNVPVVHRNGGAGNARFPLATMEVGDSFHMPWGDQDRLKARSVLSNALATFQLRNAGRKFTSRKDDTGVRVWRIA